jgi:ankyrin repeat protein
LDDGIDRDKIANFPLARYAAQHWATHARVEDVSSRIKDGMEYLFDADKPHFATWLWIYDGDYLDGRPMSTMCPKKPGAVPLYHAARLGFCDLAEHLIAEHPEHVNARGGDRVTPMHTAASAGHADILLLLLEHGADLDGQGKYNMTPLHVASFLGKLEAGQCLVDHGAYINAREEDDWTPLHWAVRKKNNIQVVRFLLERGADVNARDKRGKTPSQHAVKQKVIELLSEYAAKSVE